MDGYPNRNPRNATSTGTTAAQLRLVAPVAAATLSALAAALLAMAAPPSARTTAAPLLQRPTAVPTPDYRTSTCVVTTTTEVQPGSFLAGDSLAVTRTLSHRCALPPRYPTHVVLVLDGTASMAGEPHGELVEAMRYFAKGLEDDLGPSGRVAVVEFGTRARTTCALPIGLSRLPYCVGRVGARGSSTIGDGIEEAMRAMARGNTLWPGLSRDHIREVIIVFSSAADAVRCHEAHREASVADAQGLLLVAVCIGPDCDVQCMRGLATTPRYFFDARTLSQLRDVFEPIRRSVIAPSPRWIAFTETLPAGVALVPGSASPEPAQRLDDPTRLAWTIDRVPRDGITVTYRVRPLTPGFLPLSAGMEGAFEDDRNRGGPIAFDVPWARVLGEP